MLEVKNIVTEMKNSFDWLISKLDMAKKRIPELVDITIETLKLMNKQGKKY